MSLKDSWKKVGHDFASLGTDLGKSVVMSVRKGAEAASDWAVNDDKQKDGACDCGKEGCSCEGECDCKDDACDCGCGKENCGCKGENDACDNNAPQS